MRLLANIRYVIAVMLAFSTLSLATEAWAHSNHQHAQSAGAERQISPSTPHPNSSASGRYYEASTAIGRAFARQGKCGGAMCCGSVCVNCCSLIAPDVSFARPLLSKMWVELTTGLPQAGLGPDSIRRPPKV